MGSSERASQVSIGERRGADRSDRFPRVAIVHHLTEPRGGVFQCLHVAEGLVREGYPVHLFGLGSRERGYFRPTAAPFTVFDAPPRRGDHESRFRDAVSALADGLRSHDLGLYDVIHVHDTVDAHAVFALELEPRPTLIRTVHHLEDVETETLEAARTQAVVEPDVVLTVSRFWQGALKARYGRDCRVVTNGLDHARLRPPPGFDRSALREQVGAADRFLFLTVGGISPRKGSLHLFEALASVRAELQPAPILVIIGGHSLNSYAEYRRLVLGRAADLGLVEGIDYVFTGTVAEEAIAAWYRSADALVFPSLREGWGLVILEAMAAGLPVVASDIPVFREFLDGGDAVLVPPGSTRGLATGMARVARDPDLRRTLAERGPAVARPFSWDECAREHIEIYLQAAEMGAPSRIG